MIYKNEVFNITWQLPSLIYTSIIAFVITIYVLIVSYATSSCMYQLFNFLWYGDGDNNNQMLFNRSQLTSAFNLLSSSSLSSLKINQEQMIASNDELLFNAAKRGDLANVKELLSNGAGTKYKDAVS